MKCVCFICLAYSTSLFHSVDRWSYGGALGVVLRLGAGSVCHVQSSFF